MADAISKAALFERLAEGHAARVSVVTPNIRLAQALVSEFDAFQIRKGLSVWESPDILPFSAFVERLYEDALYSDVAAELPLLLTPAQEAWVWNEVIRNSASGKDLLETRQAAEDCRGAWKLAHEWRIAPGRGSEDAATFAAWSDLYRKKTSSDVDAGRLPDFVSSLLNENALKKPKALAAYAFDILPPQTERFFEVCSSQGMSLLKCEPERKPSAVLRTSFPSAREELEAAAKWARGRLEAGAARIGVVVPDIGERRREVARVFARVVQPGFNLPGAARTPMPFNISLGIPLSEHPLVSCALCVLQLCQEEIPFAKASALIRSPFLGGAERERAARARLDARIRRNAPASLPLPKLIGLLEESLLRETLEALFTLARELHSKQQTPSEWARHFSALLAAAGFPGERTLDSEEFQARAKWHEVLAEFAKLERVAGSMSFKHSLSIVKKICVEALFQPESGDVPIQVLGVLESAGLEFDCLWVSGLTDEAWPMEARPDPFLPVAAQKAAGVPQASAESSAALDRRITEDWKSAASEVVFSSAEKEKDRDLSPSPLIAGIARSDVPLPDYPRYRDLVFSAKNLATVKDTEAPRVNTRSVPGGTRVLADQAACPFRAYARWRLRAEPLEAPAQGLDAMKRGSLLHELMAHLWKELKDSSALQKNLEPAIAKAAEAAVRELGIEGRFAELERARLARLAREWLEVEKKRPAFEVIATEKEISLEISGLALSGRIDRLDRLEGGGHALIDYKTGTRVTPKDWQGPRPDDPQLPIYAVSAAEDVAAVTFAKLRTGSMRFMGFSRNENAIPEVKQYSAWSSLIAEWKEEAVFLGTAFAAGEAQVDPKKGLQTCRDCALHTLCRVYEKISGFSTEDSSVEDNE